jgi:hypothetical protein
MQCQLFRSLLDQAVESHAEAVSEEVRTHGITCQDQICVTAWNEYRLLHRAISAWKAELPQVDLAGRVLADLCQSPEQADSLSTCEHSPDIKEFVQTSWRDFRSPQLRPWSIALSVAALMLLIGTLILSVPQSPESHLVVRTRNNPAPPPMEASGDSSEASAPDVAIQSIEWVQRASTLMAYAIVSIPEKGAELVPEPSPWKSAWPRKLEPLRRNAHAAWDNFLEKLPSPAQPAS